MIRDRIHIKLLNALNWIIRLFSLNLWIVYLIWQNYDILRDCLDLSENALYTITLLRHICVCWPLWTNYCGYQCIIYLHYDNWSVSQRWHIFHAKLNGWSKIIFNLARCMHSNKSFIDKHFSLRDKVLHKMSNK